MARAFNLKDVIGDVSTMTAAGSSQSDAQPLAAAMVEVTAVTAGQGVRLRAQGPGTISVVSNGDDTEALNVYPWTGAAFNGKSANLPLVLAYGDAAMFVEISATKIAVIT